MKIICVNDTYVGKASSGKLVLDHSSSYNIVANYRNAECILMNSRNTSANSF